MKRLVVIVGPTAIGKTAAAITLAQQLQTEILSCDSRQFYRELEIGVARPSPAELQTVPHHFIANRSVQQPYNVYDYEHEALDLLDHLFQTHNTVIAVGGSGLYIDALCKGIHVLPDPSPQLRASLNQRVVNGELPKMLEELRQLDPEYYAIVDRSNPIRIQRALEIILTAGRPYSELLDKPLPERTFDIVKIGLQCPRETLRGRIDRRVDQMMQQGLLEEVQSLTPYRNINTLNTVGYKELFNYLDGNTQLAQAINDIKNHTWQYAKKQITWFSRYPEIKWVENEKKSDLMQVIR